MFIGIPEVSLLYNKATCSCKKSQSSCKHKILLDKDIVHKS